MPKAKPKSLFSGYAFRIVIPLTGLDLFASDIEICKHISASLGSFVVLSATKNPVISCSTYQK